MTTTDPAGRLRGYLALISAHTTQQDRQDHMDDLDAALDAAYQRGHDKGQEDERERGDRLLTAFAAFVEAVDKSPDSPQTRWYWQTPGRGHDAIVAAHAILDAQADR